MPGHKTLTRLAIIGWVVSTLAMLAELAIGLGPVFAYLLTATATLTVLAAMSYMQATTIAPVRAAFLHGYQMATQHAVAVQAAQTNPDLGRVLRPPASAWTINEPARSPDRFEQERRPGHRAPSPRQSR